MVGGYTRVGIVGSWETFLPLFLHSLGPGRLKQAPFLHSLGPWEAKTGLFPPFLGSREAKTGLFLLHLRVPGG